MKDGAPKFLGTITDIRPSLDQDQEGYVEPKEGDLYYYNNYYWEVENIDNELVLTSESHGPKRIAPITTENLQGLRLVNKMYI